MDEALLLWVNQTCAHPWLDAVFVWLSSKATFSFPMLGLLVALLGWRWGSDGLKLGLALVAVVVFGDALGALLKGIFEQPRPCATIYTLLRHPTHQYTLCEDDFSGMPSNHALNFFAVFAFLVVVLRSWRWTLPLLVVAISVAISRIYLGAHYPSQVAAGAVIGLAVGFACATLGVRRLAFMKRIYKDDRTSYSQDALDE